MSDMLFRQFLNLKIVYICIRILNLHRLLEEKRGDLNMTIKATDVVKHQQKVEKYEKEIREEQAKQREEAQRQQEAQALVNSLAGSSDAKRYKSLKGDVTDDLKEMRKTGQITKEQYEEAKEYLHSDEFKKMKEAEFTSEARSYVTGLSSASQGTKAKKVESEVRDTLRTQYENGEITKEQYEAYNKYAKRKGGFARFFGAKEKESNQLYRADANRNKVDQTREEGPQFKEKTQAKINVAGFSTDELYEIYDANGGAADGTINYSWKKKQPGERDAILTALNDNEGGYEFDMNDVKEIGRSLGYTVEKKVDGGKVVRDIARGALIGAPGSYMNVSQSQTIAGIAGQTQSVTAIGIGPAVGGTISGVASAITQAHRVEDRAIPTNVPEGITTYDDYAKYLDDYSTERGAAIGKDIAKYYTDKDGNLKVEKMNEDLSRAAGTDVSTSTPLNYEEALALLGDLKNRTPEEEPEPVVEPHNDPEPVNCELIVEDHPYERPEEAPTDCYTVKKGDNWYSVVKGKYQPKTEADAKALVRYLKDAYYEENKEALNKLGITSSRGGFFPKVGDELCVPSTITLANGTKYDYKTEGKVTPGAVTRNNNVSYRATTNPFRTMVNGTEYSVSNGCTGEEIANGLEEDQVQPVIDSTIQANPGVNYTIIRK